MKDEKSKENKSSPMPYIAIVALVAVVALVILVMNGGKGNASALSLESNSENTFTGQAPAIPQLPKQFIFETSTSRGVNLGAKITVNGVANQFPQRTSYYHAPQFAYSPGNQSVVSYHHSNRVVSGSGPTSLSFAFDKGCQSKYIITTSLSGPTSSNLLIYTAPLFQVETGYSYWPNEASLTATNLRVGEKRTLSNNDEIEMGRTTFADGEFSFILRCN